MRGKETKVLRVEPHEHSEVYMLKNTLEVIQEVVGGYIDVVGLDDNVCILLNNEGKLIGLEGNRRIGSDIIVGDFSVCDNDEEGNLTPLSEGASDTYTKIFYESRGFTKEEIEETTVIEFYAFERGGCTVMKNMETEPSEKTIIYRTPGDPIEIIDEMLENAEISPDKLVNITLQKGCIIIKPTSVPGRLPEDLFLLHEELGLSREMVECIFTKYAEGVGGLDVLVRQIKKEKNVALW